MTQNTVAPLALRRCPICGRPREAAHDPFCSKRCTEIDLSRWLKGVYAIPGTPLEDADDPAADDAPPEKE